MRCGYNLRCEEEMYATGNYLMVKYEEVELSGLCLCSLGLLVTHCTFQADLKLLVAIIPLPPEAT